MAKAVRMPKLGMTMETGTILRWFKEVGDTVQAGESLLEVMTDKINIEEAAYASGTLLKRYYGEDETVATGVVIGYIGEPGEPVPDTPPAVDAAAMQAAPGAAAPAPAAAVPEAALGHMLLRATPSARRLAREAGVALAAVPGSGPNGRIHRQDVDRYVQERSGVHGDARPAVPSPAAAASGAAAAGAPAAFIAAAPAAPAITSAAAQAAMPTAPKPAAPAAATAPGLAGAVNGAPALAAAGQRRKLDGVRRVIAQRMVQSAFSAPHVTLHTELDMGEAKRLREELLPIVQEQTGHRISFTEIIVKAAAHALRRHPALNATTDGEWVEQHADVHIGVAVSHPQGLYVPVIRHADRLGLAELTERVKTLAQDVRDNRLKPEHMSGGTFTVSNLGMYDIDGFTPIINSPEAAILGVGRIRDKPVCAAGAVEIRPMMTVSLSFDHRVTDGAPAAAFLTELKRLLEKPQYLLL